MEVTVTVPDGSRCTGCNFLSHNYGADETGNAYCGCVIFKQRILRNRKCHACKMSGRGPEKDTTLNWMVIK